MRWLYPLLIAGVLVGVPAIIFAQVAQQNAGQSLDANYQIGSGGYNTVNGGQAGVNSQLYINQQVTGLAAFRGQVPMEATNQLRVAVPSAAMGDFVRTSVGVPQALTNTAYSTTAYYNPSRTVFNVPAIMSGLASPGSNSAMGQLGPAAVQRIYSEVTQAYQPILPPTQLTGPTALYTPTGVMATPTGIVSRPGAIALFGVPQYVQGTELALEVRRFLQGGREKVPAALPGEDGLKIGGQETLGGTDTRELAGSTRGGKLGAPLANQDAYLDLLLTLQKQIQAQESKVAPVSPGEVPEETTPNHGVKQPGNEPGQTTPGTVVPGTENPYPGGSKPLVERDKSGIVIHGLAGLSPDTFNMYMNRAKTLMKEGKYYDASQEYELAAIVDRTNPMAPLGACMAIFTAGEPYSAAIHLRKAMSLLPPLMETRLDIGSMVKQDDFEAMVGTLDHRIANEPGRIDPLLVYVSAFMHQNMGQTAQARAAAKMLRDTNTKDTIFLAYANFVLTGQRPTSQPAKKN
jgi:tetratricopeptide (TPR) repeat protein